MTMQEWMVDYLSWVGFM